MVSSADEIDEGFAHFSTMRAAVDAELCRLIQAADASQVWMSDGARSLAEWVSLRLRIRFSAAKRMVAMARRLLDLPVVFSAFAEGELSWDEVDSISRVATSETEESLLREMAGLSNHELDRLARHAKPPTDDEEQEVWERRRLVRQWNLDQSELKFWGNLHGDAGQAFDTAIDEAVDRMPANPETGMFDPVETRAADALAELSATTGDRFSPPQVTLHADLDALTSDVPSVAELASGALIPNEAARRLCCDAMVETAIREGNVIIGVGRNTRVVPGWLRRQLQHRDGGRCRFPGCGGRRWLQAHHIRHWADGGPTDLDNLILLCGHHRRFLHEHQWTITTTGDQIIFGKPDGTIYPTKPPSLHPRLAQLTTSRSP